MPELQVRAMTIKLRAAKYPKSASPYCGMRSVKCKSAPTAAPTSTPANTIAAATRTRWRAPCLPEQQARSGRRVCAASHPLGTDRPPRRTGASAATASATSMCWRERPLTGNFRDDRERPELAGQRPTPCRSQCPESRRCCRWQREAQRLQGVELGPSLTPQDENSTVLLLNATAANFARRLPRHGLSATGNARRARRGPYVGFGTECQVLGTNDAARVAASSAATGRFKSSAGDDAGGQRACTEARRCAFLRIRAVCGPHPSRLRGACVDLSGF
jgi:hypothetical protein